MKLLRCGCSWSPKLRAARPIAQPICHKMFPLKKPQPKLYFGTRSVSYFWSVVHCNNAGGWWILHEPLASSAKIVHQQQATVTWSRWRVDTRCSAAPLTTARKCDNFHLNNNQEAPSSILILEGDNQSGNHRAVCVDCWLFVQIFSF